MDSQRGHLQPLYKKLEKGSCAVVNKWNRQSVLVWELSSAFMFGKRSCNTKQDYYKGTYKSRFQNTAQEIWDLLEFTGRLAEIFEKEAESSKISYKTQA